MDDTLVVIQRIIEDSDKPVNICIVQLPKDKSIGDLVKMSEVIDSENGISAYGLRGVIGSTAYDRATKTDRFLHRLTMLDTGIDELDKIGHLFWKVWRGKSKRGSPSKLFVSSDTIMPISCSDGGVVFSFLIEKEDKK